MKIALDKITADPKQPRKEFDPDQLNELADSIHVNGLIQPITVRPRGKDTFWIVAGERRYRAHCLLRDRGTGITEIDAIVRKPPGEMRLRVHQVVENVIRADFTLLEEAHAYAELAAFGMTPEEVAKEVGVPAHRVRSRIALLGLEPTLMQLLATDQFDKQHALELARLPKHADQLRLFQMINRGEIGHWRSLRKAVDTIVGGITQEDLFGESAPAAAAVDLAVLNAMERKITAVADALAAGWKDGECIIAAKVSPDRAALIADRLVVIRGCVRHMERELRNVTAQARIVLDA